MQSRSHQEVLDRAIKLFNRGKYLDSSEELERLASDAEEPLSTLASTLNRIAAGLHLRFYRGSYQGALNLLSQALLTLEEGDFEQFGINAGSLRTQLEALIEEIRAGGREYGLIRKSVRLFRERRIAPKIIVSS